MDKFLIRTPVFPIEYLEDFHESDNPSDFIFSFFENNELFRESIYLYSKSLYTEVLNLKGTELKNLKKLNKTSDSLLKYFLRMCYRATPFGVSAGISVSSFCRTNNSKDINYSHRKVKIDSGVFSNILNEINENPVVRNNIKFFKNNTLFKNNKYLRLIEKKHLNNAFDFKLVKIDNTEILEEILKISERGITLNYIRDVLQKDYDDITRQDINEFINELIKSQLIISELQYDVLNVNYENGLLNKLHSVYRLENDASLLKQINFLEKINDLILKLEGLTIDERGSLEILKEVDVLIEPYNNTGKSSLQVDLIGNPDFSLNEKIKCDIKENIPFFLKINSELSNPNKFTTFKKDFLDKFENKVVPLLEVLDPELGIGYPSISTSEPESSLLKNINIRSRMIPEIKFRKWDEFLIDKFESYLKEEKEVIKITKSDLGFIRTPDHKIKDSVLFTGQVFENRADNYKYFFNSMKVGSAHFSAGRFNYDSSKIGEYGKEITDFEIEKLNKNQIFAEISHLSQPRIGNISKRRNYYRYYIPIWDTVNDLSSYNISLNDLYVFLQDDKIILYSKKLNKQVIPRLGCAQNTHLLTNSIYKFLGAIGDDFFISFWDWSILKGKPYLPRVEYENFIISKAQWRLDKTEIYNSNSQHISVLKEYLNNLNIKKNVTMTIGGDNNLPLDLENAKSIQLLNKELLLNKVVILEECLFFSEERLAVSSNYGQVTNEVHIPFLLNSLKKDLINLDQGTRNDKNATNIKLFPGEQSLFFKVYIKSDKVDKIFINKLLLLIYRLQNDEHIEKFFFIRYFDPDYHFRLRFFSPKLDLNIILTAFNSIFKNEMDALIINKVEISTYEREIERYGGKKGLDISEKIFHMDSFCMLQVLFWTLENKKESEKWLLAMLGTHYLLNDFHIMTEHRIKILTELKNYYSRLISNNKEVNKNISAFFRTNKEKIKTFMQIKNFENQYFTYFKMRSMENKPLIQDLENEGVNYDVKNYVHMSLNRFFEKKQNYQELVIYDLLVIYYKSQKFIK